MKYLYKTSLPYKHELDVMYDFTHEYLKLYYIPWLWRSGKVLIGNSFLKQTKLVFSRSKASLYVSFVCRWEWRVSVSIGFIRKYLVQNHHLAVMTHGTHMAYDQSLGYLIVYSYGSSSVVERVVRVVLLCPGQTRWAYMHGWATSLYCSSRGPCYPHCLRLWHGWIITVVDLLDL